MLAPADCRLLCADFARRLRRAVTLVELLVTMSVVAILMLGGVAVYFRMNRGFALQAATSSIESTLRAARHFAIHERSPAVVATEPQEDNPALIARVYAIGRQTVSNWHFEHPKQFTGDKVLGALGQEATVTGTLASAPGRMGTALALDGAGTSLQVISPYLDGLREGVFIEAYVWPDATGLSPGAILPIVCKDTRASAAFRLELVYKGNNIFHLQGAVRVETDGGGQEVSLTGTNIPIFAGEWTHVAMAYTREGKDASGNNNSALVLRVNGQEAARHLENTAGGSKLLAPNTSPLTIGSDGASFFKGRLDELEIAGLVVGENREMPKNTEVTLDPGGSKDGRIHFDPEGRLDPAHHARPVIFRIISAEDRLMRSVRVGWLGNVEVFEGEPPAE